jgi:hypothetical protein
VCVGGDVKSGRLVAILVVLEPWAETGGEPLLPLPSSPDRWQL